MVEGHQVHRVQHQHAAVLKGKAFKATSPNGRFADGAAAVNGRVLADVQAVGKNLAYEFARPGAESVFVRVHFGMSGRHAAFAPSEEPATTATTRLRLEAADGSVVTHLSAMTVEAGGPEVLAGLLSTLGPDPLRADADPARFWAALQKSKRSVGYELMRQEALAGVGNIYRAEVLHFARVHPDTPAGAVTQDQFKLIWSESVRQMRAGFETGSIVTVPESLRPTLADPTARRVVYNRPRCAVCGGRVVSWAINARTAYACEACQPPAHRAGGGKAAAPAPKAAPRLFASRCAPEASPALVGGAAPSLAPSLAYLTVPQLRAALVARGIPEVETKGLLKAALLARLEAAESASRVKAEPATPPAKRGRKAASTASLPTPGTAGLSPADADAAAAEKAAAGEGRNVEHVALDAGDATVWLAGKKEKKGVKKEKKADAAGGRLGPVTPAAPASKRGKR